MTTNIATATIFIPTALRGFTGAIIAATHDRRFLEGFGGTVLTMGNRQLNAAR